MTEEQIRKIVRDEIVKEALKEDGIYDHCRLAAFNMFRLTMEDAARKILGSFEPEA